MRAEVSERKKSKNDEDEIELDSEKSNLACYIRACALRLISSFGFGCRKNSTHRVAPTCLPCAPGAPGAPK